MGEDYSLTSLSCFFIFARLCVSLVFGLRKDEIFSTVNRKATNGGLASYCMCNLGQEALPGYKPFTSLFFVLLNIEQN